MVHAYRVADNGHKYNNSTAYGLMAAAVVRSGAVLSIHSWRTCADSSPTLLQGTAIHTADPGAQVVGPASENIDLAFLRGVFEAGERGCV